MSRWNIPIEVQSYKEYLSSLKSRQNILTPVVALGDSVTESIGCACEKRWTTILEGMLNRKVINAGIGGTTSAFGLWRLERDVLSLNPSVVIVCFLLNDGNIAGWETPESYFPKMTPEYSAQCINQIVNRCRRAGTEVIIWTANPIGKNYPNNLEGCPMQKDFHRIQKTRYEFFLNELMDLAEREKVPVADTYHEFLGLEDYESYLFPDHIHPNDKAQGLITECIYKKYKEEMK